jgi:ribosomal protein L34E
MGSCLDLRRYINDQSTFDAFSKLVSGGKAGYKSVIERRKETPRCKKCNKELEGIEKFCPECGEKTEWQKKAEEPVVLLTTDELEKKFKSEEIKEHEALAYLRDELKIPEITAFELVEKWRRELQQENTTEIPVDYVKR